MPWPFFYSIGRVPPCGAGSFLSGQKGTKDPLGVSFDEHLACASAHRPRPPDPRLRGNALLLPWTISSGGRNQVGLSFLSRGHRPLPGLNLDGNRVVQTPPGTAEPGKFGGEGRSFFDSSPAYGREAKRSFAESSLPSFLSRKRSKRGVDWQTAFSLVCCVGRTNFMTWR